MIGAICVARRLMDLTGDRYGQLTVLREGEPIVKPGQNRKIRQWVCVCDCGNETVVRHGNLRGGSIKSCGCQQDVRKNFIGHRYGRLTILEEAEDIRFPSKSVKRVFVCVCDCGNVLKVRHDAMATGNTNSCGCYKRDQTSLSNTNKKTTHGLNDHPLYSTWSDMNRRCYNEKTKHFHNYGGRGIYVCEEWRHSPTEFVRWATEETDWHEGCDLTLDRIDVNGNYEPSNCRFADKTTQALNRRVGKNNTSGFRGVHWRQGKWSAVITYRNKRYELGLYTRIEYAAEARQLKELELFGELLPETEIATDKVRLELEKINKESI